MERTERVDLFDNEETNEKVRLTLHDALAELTLPLEDLHDTDVGPEAGKNAPK